MAVRDRGAVVRGGRPRGGGGTAGRRAVPGVDAGGKVRLPVPGRGPRGGAVGRGAPVFAEGGGSDRPGFVAPAGRRVTDLRGGRGGRPGGLVFASGDLVVVSGLPGSGKSTLIRRTTEHGMDSQDARERWAGRLPRRLPYVLYRPLVRLAHYAALRRALRTGRSAVVHDCGTQPWVRRWLAREARGRGCRLHLVLLDVAPEVARTGQRERGRGVSRYAFARHRRALTALLVAVGSARLPAGCDTAVLLDRDSAAGLARIAFTTAGVGDNGDG